MTTGKATSTPFEVLAADLSPGGVGVQAFVGVLAANAAPVALSPQAVFEVIAAHPTPTDTMAVSATLARPAASLHMTATPPADTITVSATCSRPVAGVAAAAGNRLGVGGTFRRPTGAVRAVSGVVQPPVVIPPLINPDQPLFSFSNQNYVDAFLALLPSGKIWDKSPNSNLSAVVAALVPTFQRLSDRAENLLVDAFPATTLELLGDWENSLGLPDPCLGQFPTIEARRAEVVARLCTPTAPTIAGITAYAMTLGYSITIDEFSPFYADIGGADQRLYQADAAYLWRVNAPSQDLVTYFSADVSTAGDPIASFASTVLYCELTRLAPAHTQVIFEYSADPIGVFSIGISSIG